QHTDSQQRYSPKKTREKQASLKNDPVPLPRALLKKFSVDHRDRPKPDLMFARHPNGGATNKANRPTWLLVTHVDYKDMALYTASGACCQVPMEEIGETTRFRGVAQPSVAAATANAQAT